MGVARERGRSSPAQLKRPRESSIPLLLNRYNKAILLEVRMSVSLPKRIPAWLIAILLFPAVAGTRVGAQTVRVDASPERAIKFDPDRAMGSSLDILSAKE